MGKTKSIVILAILMHLQALSLSPISGNFGAIVWVFLESCNCSNMFFISFQHQWKLVELTIHKLVGTVNDWMAITPIHTQLIYELLVLQVSISVEMI